jgi:hypothetical protein
MKKHIVITISVLVLILAALVVTTGCDSVRGGANIVLENVTIGSITMDGKPVTGMPAQTVNVILKASTSTVKVSTSNGKTILKLEPSGAVVTSGPDGLQFTGLKQEQVEIQWPQATTTK